MQQDTVPTRQDAMTCDACKTEAAAAVHLEEYGGHTLCAPHTAERRVDDATDELIGRTLGQILGTRYKYQPAQLVKDWEAAGLDKFAMRDTVDGSTFNLVDRIKKQVGEMPQ